jgi:hypothetical protein
VTHCHVRPRVLSSPVTLRMQQRWRRLQRWLGCGLGLRVLWGHRGGALRSCVSIDRHRRLVRGRRVVRGVAVHVLCASSLRRTEPPSSLNLWGRERMQRMMCVCLLPAMTLRLLWKALASWQRLV